MDYKGFRKVSEDNRTATMAHPSGHKIVIVKSGLSGKLKKALKALPLHQEDPNGPIGESAPPQDSQVDPSMPKVSDLPPDQQQEASPPQASQDTLEQQREAIPSLGQNYAHAVDVSDQEEAANKEMLQAKAGAEDRASGNINDEVGHLKNIMNASDKEIGDWQKDYRNGFIKPNDYVDNMSAPQKVTTAIGLILGGIGGMGKGNVAMDYLNKQIDRNLEAQRANQGARANILSALENKYKNKLVAEDMFRVLNASLYSHDLNQAALKAGTKMAAVENQKAQIALADKYRPMKMMADAYSYGSTSNAPPAARLQTLQMANVLSPEESKQATADLDILEKTKAAHEAVDQSANMIAEQQKAKNRLNPANAYQASQLIDSATANISANLMASAPSKRFTPDALNAMIKPHIQGFFTGKKTAEQMKKDMHSMVDVASDKPQTYIGVASRFGLPVPKYVPLVSVIDPSGKTGKIPENQLQHALKQGYRQAK